MIFTRGTEYPRSAVTVAEMIEVGQFVGALLIRPWLRRLHWSLCRTSGSNDKAHPRQGEDRARRPRQTLCRGDRLKAQCPLFALSGHRLVCTCLLLTQGGRYHYRSSFPLWTSRMSRIGHSGAMVPVHLATVFANNRSSLRKSVILARMSVR